jgi:hypothetical protein
MVRERIPERIRTMKKLMPFVVLLALAAAGSAAATTPVGVRAGITDWNQTNQVHLGLDFRLGEVLPNVEFTPNIELGMGDDTTILSINGDLAYQFTELVTSPWGLYGGGALSLHYLDFSNHTDTDLGLNGLLGVTKVFTNGHLGLVEIRLGILDSPDFKLTFGYSLF